MLERESVLFSKDTIELRFIFSLPAKCSGNQFDAEQTWLMLEQELKAIVDYALYYRKYSEETRNTLDRFIEIQQTRLQIKQYMESNGLCVFINNVARLPRQSGIDDRPAT